MTRREINSQMETASERFLRGERLIHPSTGRPEEYATRAEPTTAAQAWLTGTGAPSFAVSDRAGPSTLLRFGDELVVVDCGNGTAHQLAKLGVRAIDISRVFITHHHFDHNSDLGFMLLTSWVVRGGHKPPIIVGPRGTFEYVDRVLWSQHYDMFARLPHGYDPAELAVKVVEIEDGTRIWGSGWCVTAFEVDHAAVDQAFGYRFDGANASIVISGDTRPSQNLIQHAKGADLLVHEAIFPGFGFPEYHTLSTDVGKVAAEAEVRHLVLTHLLPGDRLDAEWLEHAAAHFSGPVTVGHDLLRIL